MPTYPWRLAVALLLVVVAVLGLSRGFFSGDSGVKFAQAHALWQSSFSSRALPYDYDFDSDGRYFPYGKFLREVDGEHQGIYSVVFTAVAAPAIGLLGLHGIVLVPLVGGVLVIIGLRRLLLQLGQSSYLADGAAAIAGLATPALFSPASSPSMRLRLALLFSRCRFLSGPLRRDGLRLRASSERSPPRFARRRIAPWRRSV